MQRYFIANDTIIDFQGVDMVLAVPDFNNEFEGVEVFLNNGMDHEIHGELGARFLEEYRQRAIAWNNMDDEECLFADSWPDAEDREDRG